MTKPYILENNLGTTIYFKDEDCNILHRTDGPAIEFFDGTKIWYLNDKEYSEKEYYILTIRKNLINFL